MPLYEYYCRPCQTKFELLRPMKMSSLTANCPEGHEGATRTISVFSAIGRDEMGESMPLGGGGCACGGACACGAQ